MPVRLSRRSFLGAALTLPLAGCGKWPNWSWRKGNPFALGVASGSPASDGFVIWTRLHDSGLTEDSPVAFEIASDETMTNIVQAGSGTASAKFGSSVHVEVAGLAPGRPYWYRFMHGNASSRIGRAMTLPAPGTPLEQLRIGMVSCSNYEQGYFSAYRHLADETPDFVTYLGDYFYEYIDQKPGKVREHSDGVETMTLETYRNRLVQYRLDADLQRLHAEAPALVIWDDHEVQNDYADKWSQTLDEPENFLLRRAAAYQAYYEFMPLRKVSQPNGASMRIYDRYSFGNLAEISMLDGRQYRSRMACYSPETPKAHLETNAHCPERLDPTRSIIGTEQEAWLFDGLSNSKATWNVIAQDVLMAQFRQKNPAGETAFWTDDWNGYPASRTRLLTHLHQRQVANPVVLTGDIHSFWANDLKLDFDDPKSPTVGTELVGTSVTAYGPPHDIFVQQLAENGNTHVRFFDARVHGYAMIDITRERLGATFRVVSDAKDPAATIATLKSFAVEAGKPGVQEA